MSSSRYTAIPAYSQVYFSNITTRESQRVVYTNDFILVTDLTVGLCKQRTSGITGFPNVTGGEYKTWERIHRDVADSRLLAIPAS